MSGFNAWHNLNAGDNIPEIITAIIEIPKDSKAKFELDKESGLIKLDRVLKTPMGYPANYGFIPQTYCEDKDPLDVFVICSQNLPSGVMVSARVVGVIKMIDGGEQDDKIIAIAEDDAFYANINDLTDLPEIVIGEMRVFLEDYKKLQKKVVEVTDILPKSDAQRIVLEAVDLYKKSF
jgi:inorganic pyrophosphatase